MEKNKEMEEEEMSGLWTALSGYKTYILMFAAGVYTVLIATGIVPSLDWVWQLLGVGTVAALRDALPKSTTPSP